MLCCCSAVLAVWALEIASTLSTRSLELSFAAALSGAKGTLNPQGLDLEGVLQVEPKLCHLHLQGNKLRVWWQSAEAL